MFEIKKAAAITLLVSLLAAVAFIMPACSGGGNGSGTATQGGTAATVNGQAISEDSVTAYVEKMRTDYGLLDNEDWKQYLIDTSSTPENIREEAIDTLARRMILAQAAKDELGIEVDQQAIDEQIALDKESIESSEQSWDEYIKEYYGDESAYKDEIENMLLEAKLLEHFESDELINKEAVAQSLAQITAKTPLVKKVSAVVYGHIDPETGEIVITEEDIAAAREMCDKLRAGELTFEQAIEARNNDLTTEIGSGELGWEFFDENYAAYNEPYMQAVSALDIGQVSDPVDTGNGLSILAVTEVYTFPEDPISHLAEMPEGVRDYVLLTSGNSASQLCEDWISQHLLDVDVQINDMPSGLSYYVDVPEPQEADVEEPEETEEATE